MTKQTDARIPVTFTTEEIDFGLPGKIEEAAKKRRMKKAVFLKWLATEFIEGRLAGFYAPIQKPEKLNNPTEIPGNQVSIFPGKKILDPERDSI